MHGQHGGRASTCETHSQIALVCEIFAFHNPKSSINLERKYCFSNICKQRHPTFDSIIFILVSQGCFILFRSFMDF